MMPPQTSRARRLRLNLEDTKFSICEYAWLRHASTICTAVAHRLTFMLQVQCQWFKRN